MSASPRSVRPRSDGGSVLWTEASEAAFESLALRERVLAFDPQAVIGATVYAASVALRLRLELPFWADVFGDFMAEAQARARVGANDGVVARFWQAFLPVLEHADRFSCVCETQRWALTGQLGLSGRLSSLTAFEPLVSLIPCAAEAQRSPVEAGPLVRGVRLPEEAFLVLWSGSFNTWCDVDTLFAGLELAMRRERRMYFVSTGGAVRGHDEKTYRRFC